MYFRKAGGVYAKVAPDSDEWKTHIDKSANYLPSWISPAIRASKSLSVTQINSFEAKDNVFWGGKVLLIGQACAEIEPYLGKSCDVAARQSRTLAEVLSGPESLEDRKKKLVEEWSPDALSYTRSVAAASKSAGMLFRGKSDQ
jgi:2-polyprenyl-6-methoxyphenol hydroxylase-like FAD-dependent oxidoreductase